MITVHVKSDLSRLRQDMTPCLTVIGDRQHGKSYLLGLAAIDAAVSGLTVFYQCESRTMARERFFDLEQRANRFGLLERVYRANGDRRLLFTGGGVIRFHFRGDTVDLHIIDDLNAMPLPGARRVIRAALR